jgi:polysaccharide pyruvyl transferase WcaK-like protein
MLAMLRTSGILRWPTVLTASAAALNHPGFMRALTHRLVGMGSWFGDQGLFLTRLGCHLPESAAGLTSQWMFASSELFDTTSYDTSSYAVCFGRRASRRPSRPRSPQAIGIPKSGFHPRADFKLTCGHLPVLLQPERASVPWEGQFRAYGSRGMGHGGVSKGAGGRWWSWSTSRVCGRGHSSCERCVVSWTAKRRSEGDRQRPEWRIAWTNLVSRRSESKVRVIAFFGRFGTGNIGNEASLSSAVLAAQRLDPTAELVCVCARPDVVQLEHGITAVPIHMAGLLPGMPPGPRLLRIARWPLYELARWISAYRFLRRIDLVMVPGTGILDDFGDIPRGMPYDVFRWSLTTRLARKRFAFLSVGAGPITHPVSRFLLKYAVRFSSYCSYRDEASCSFMAGIGASTIDSPVMPDIVFALPRPARPAVPSAHTTIGLGVMSYYGWANEPAGGEDIFRTYIEKMSTIACRILDNGQSIRILIGEKNDERGVHALLETIRRRRDSDAGADRLIVEPIASMRDLLDQIGSTDAVIGTRYHNVVGALMMNRPVVSLGYAAKFVDVMTSMGLGRYCHDVEAMAPDAVLNDLDELLGKWEEFSPGVETGNQQYIEELERQFAALINITP